MFEKSGFGWISALALLGARSRGYLQHKNTDIFLYELPFHTLMQQKYGASTMVIATAFYHPYCATTRAVCMQFQKEVCKE